MSKQGEIKKELNYAYFSSYEENLLNQMRHSTVTRKESGEKKMSLTYFSRSQHNLGRINNEHFVNISIIIFIAPGKTKRNGKKVISNKNESNVKNSSLLTRRYAFTFIFLSLLFRKLLFCLLPTTLPRSRNENY